MWYGADISGLQWVDVPFCQRALICSKCDESISVNYTLLICNINIRYLHESVFTYHLDFIGKTDVEPLSTCTIRYANKELAWIHLLILSVSLKMNQRQILTKTKTTTATSAFFIITQTGHFWQSFLKRI